MIKERKRVNLKEFVGKNEKMLWASYQLFLQSRTRGYHFITDIGARGKHTGELVDGKLKIGE